VRRGLVVGYFDLSCRFRVREAQEPHLLRSLHKIDRSMAHISSFNRAGHFIAAYRHAATVKRNVPSGFWKCPEGELILLDDASNSNRLILARPHPARNIVTNLFE